MMTLVYMVAAILGVTLIALAIRMAMGFLAWRGSRVVTCPEVGRPAAVRVDARHAAVTAVLRAPELRLAACSRWPERADCGQECLAEIEHAPDGCLVRARLTGWYAGRACATCHRPIGEIAWHERRPALMTPEGDTLAWQEIPAERLPDVLATHRPLCWNCHVITRLRSRHPELVTDCRWPHA